MDLAEAALVLAAEGKFKVGKAAVELAAVSAGEDFGRVSAWKDSAESGVGLGWEWSAAVAAAAGEHSNEAWAASGGVKRLVSAARYWGVSPQLLPLPALQGVCVHVECAWERDGDAPAEHALRGNLVDHALLLARGAPTLKFAPPAGGGGSGLYCVLMSELTGEGTTAPPQGSAAGRHCWLKARQTPRPSPPAHSFQSAALVFGLERSNMACAQRLALILVAGQRGAGRLGRRRAAALRPLGAAGWLLRPRRCAAPALCLQCLCPGEQRRCNPCPAAAMAPRPRPLYDRAPAKKRWKRPCDAALPW